MSNVLFVCTANFLGTLHPALRDRMEIIDLSGYTYKEKVHIFDKYLLPQAYKNAGLENHQKDVILTDEARDRIINDYCREPGVRSLQRYVNRIMEKAALKLVRTPGK